MVHRLTRRRHRTSTDPTGRGASSVAPDFWDRTEARVFAQAMLRFNDKPKAHRYTARFMYDKFGARPAVDKSPEKSNTVNVLRGLKEFLKAHNLLGGGSTPSPATNDDDEDDTA